jgi:hypothetical protein
MIFSIQASADPSVAAAVTLAQHSRRDSDGHNKISDLGAVVMAITARHEAIS